MYVHKSSRGSKGSHYLGGTTVSSSYTHTFRLPIPSGSHQYRPARQLHTTLGCLHLGPEVQCQSLTNTHICTAVDAL